MNKSLLIQSLGLLSKKETESIGLKGSDVYGELSSIILPYLCLLLIPIVRVLVFAKTVDFSHPTPHPCGTYCTFQPLTTSCLGKRSSMIFDKSWKNGKLELPLLIKLVVFFFLFVLL